MKTEQEENTEMNFEKVRDVIVETVNCEEDAVTLDASLKDDLSLDSLDAMELSMALEEAYNITIDEEELANFITVRNIVDYIDSTVA